MFLDALPADALRGKPVLALATGGSPARHIVDAVYAVDGQLQHDEHGGFRCDAALLDRLDALVALPC